MDEILKQLASRDATGGRWGIGTAAVYMQQLEASSDPAKLFGASAGEWTAAKEAAKNRLTFCDPGMVVESFDPGGKAEFDVWDHAVKLVKITPDISVGLPVLKRASDGDLNSAMEFDAIITTNRVDRDGDILEPKGAIPDPAMPLLWQHIPMEPIGKLLKISQQNSKRVKGRFAIADTPLGRDAAELVEFGALRISHGFIPTDFEERKNGKKDDANGEFLGWHITAYEIIEVSLVSVPSNTDAVVTAFSRQKLHHPAVKQWASTLNDERPVMVPVKSIEPAVSQTKTASEDTKSNPVEEKSVVPYHGYPPADKGQAWDAPAAVGRMRTWAGGPAKEDIDWAKYRNGFSFVRGDGKGFGDYILPHHDVSDGKLVTVFKGLAAAVAVLNGARGGVADLSDADRKGIHAHLKKHYAQFDEEIPDLKSSVDELPSRGEVTSADVTGFIVGCKSVELLNQLRTLAVVRIKELNRDEMSRFLSRI